MLTTDAKWYVLFCKPRRETQVCTLLDAKGFETFLPTYAVPSGRRRCSPKQEPLFPRYLFVQVELERVGTSELEWIPGSVGFVKYGDVPAPVPNEVIEELKRRRLDLKHRGVSTQREFSRGDAVRIVSGPLSGYEAIFDLRLNGSERVRVLLRLLGRHLMVTLNTNAIEAPSSSHC